MNTCYNCKASNHISKNCPLAQKYTRCPDPRCEVMTLDGTGHKEDCTMKSFKSQLLKTSATVFEAKELALIEFKGIDERFVVLDGDKEMRINNIPLWFAASECHVGLFGKRSLKLVAARPMQRRFTILDRNNRPIVCLVFDERVLVVNNRYRIRANGMVSFDYEAKNEIFTPMLTRIKVFNDDVVFKMRISVFNKRFVFDVHPFGPILVDRHLVDASDANTATIANAIEL